MRIKFNYPFIQEAGTVHFITHRSNTMQFSKILKIKNFDKFVKFTRHNGIRTAYYNWIGNQYWISQELFLMCFEDKFASIRNFFKWPLSLFTEQDDIYDVNSYLVRLLRGFRKTHGKATLNLPLRRNLFDLPIDDALFVNYSTERFEQDRRAPISSNYQREYVETVE